MGCNCKKKYDVLKKYSDNPSESDGNGGILWKIVVFLAQMVFGILIAPLIIVIAAIFIIYMIICIMFGLEPNIVLKIPFKKHKNKQ